MIEISNKEAQVIIDMFESMAMEYGTAKCEDPVYLRLKQSQDSEAEDRDLNIGIDGLKHTQFKHGNKIY